MGHMQLKPTMQHAKQSNGTAIIVKLLYPSSDKLWILQCLHSIKSQINPTIHLLRVLELNVGMFVFLLKATPLDLEIKLKMISQSKVVDLSNQSIKGVRFLHDHGIAYLDIKPQNIVVLQN
jgi:serine/threonine protein kinase